MRHALRRAAALVLAGPLTACAQPAPADGAPDEGAARLRNDCAACHGAQRGRDGQKKPVLSRLTPDLTGLAARNSGEFPTDSVARVSDGRGFEMLAHGSLDVPVWGALERRSQVANAQARVECRVEAPAE